MARRPLVRCPSATCPDCFTSLTVRVPPRAYVRHVAGKPTAVVMWRSDCLCGGELKITAGEVRRAA